MDTEVSRRALTPNGLIERARESRRHGHGQKATVRYKLLANS